MKMPPVVGYGYFLESRNQLITKKVEGGLGEGRSLGGKGTGSVREVGAQGLGSWISKVAGSRRNTEEITQHCAIFCYRNSAKRGEPTKIGREPGLRVQEGGSLNLPVPPPKKCFVT